MWSISNESCFNTSRPSSVRIWSPKAIYCLSLQCRCHCWLQPLLSAASHFLYNMSSCTSITVAPVEYRSVIRFLILLGKDRDEIHEMLHDGYGDSTPSSATVNRWIAEFRHGRVDVMDEPRPGRPPDTVTPDIISRCENFILSDRRITYEELMSFPAHLPWICAHDHP